MTLSQTLTGWLIILSLINITNVNLYSLAYFLGFGKWFRGRPTLAHWCSFS
ncbi:hypothetical protein [Moraxella lacunata]|uniref:hypothetical protein n=1 Tax=Moraxella lacunata TaxID=477 RepID=UPI003EDF2C9D